MNWAQKRLSALLAVFFCALSACQYVSRLSGRADSPPATADAHGEFGADDDPGVVGASDVFRGGGGDDITQAEESMSMTSASDSQAANDADGIVTDGAFMVAAPWAEDGGAAAEVPLFSFPAPDSLPPANGLSGPLALSADARNSDAGIDGCGEPVTCFLRMIVETAKGNLYSARLSAAYPNDTCVTKTIPSAGTVLLGDPTARFGQTACRAGTPEISLGFVVPYGLLIGWRGGQTWESTDGFRSEWRIVDGGEDSGAYEPIPGLTSKLAPASSQYFDGGEIYGELLVPLRHAVTHEPALGFALFDIRVRD